MANLFYQAAFDLGVRTLTGRADYFVAPCNAAAVGLVETFPYAFSAGIICGERGCGKTHLAHLFAETVIQKTGKQAVFIKSSDINLCGVEKILAENSYAVVEDLAPPVEEEALLHLMNGMNQQRGFVLLTSSSAPSEWGLRLADVATRLKAVPCIRIGAPDEALIGAVLVKQFSDRQLNVAPDVISYLLKNMERSFAAAAFAVRRADEISLAEKRAVTIPVVRQVLAEYGAVS